MRNSYLVLALHCIQAVFNCHRKSMLSGFCFRNSAPSGEFVLLQKGWATLCFITGSQPAVELEGVSHQADFCMQKYKHRKRRSSSSELL